MDQHIITTRLNIAAGTPLVLHGLTHELWGRTLRFDALAKPADAPERAFSLCFDDCREMRWQLYTHLQDAGRPPFPQTTIANFKLGRGQHRSPSHILTEHFGLSLFYGAAVLVVDGERSDLA